MSGSMELLVLNIIVVALDQVVRYAGFTVASQQTTG
jgi:hypothetical protein